MIHEVRLKYDIIRGTDQYLSISGIDLPYLFTSLQGFEFPDVKIDIKDNGNSNGAILGTRFYGRRVIRLEGVIEVDSLSEFEEARRNLMEVCVIHNGLKEVVLVTRTGLELKADCIVTSRIEASYEMGERVGCKFRIEMTAPFPFFESTIEQEFDIEPYGSAGGEIPMAIPFAMTSGASSSTTVTNDGNIFSYPIFVISGGVENPSVLNETTGETFSLIYTLEVGDDVEIDVLSRTVLLNGTTNIAGYFSGDWITIQQGDNLIKFTGTNPTGEANVNLKFRDTYLGI